MKVITPEVLALLTAPFDEKDVYFAPKHFNKERTSAMMFPHLKAEAIITRFNEVCGIDGWSHTSHVNDDRSVTVTIYLRFGAGEEGVVSHSGIGTPNNPEHQDATKSAESDAIKRAARNFNVGLEFWTGAWESIWVDWDKDKGRPNSTQAEMLQKSKNAAARKEVSGSPEPPVDKTSKTKSLKDRLKVN